MIQESNLGNNQTHSKNPARAPDMPSFDSTPFYSADQQWPPRVPSQNEE